MSLSSRYYCAELEVRQKLSVHNDSVVCSCLQSRHAVLPPAVLFDYRRKKRGATEYSLMTH